MKSFSVHDVFKIARFTDAPCIWFPCFQTPTKVIFTRVAFGNSHVLLACLWQPTSQRYPNPASSTPNKTIFFYYVS